MRSGASSAISSMLGGKAQPEKKSYPSAWDLPVVSEEEVDQMMGAQNRRTGYSVRRRSSGTSRGSIEAFMSGGLGSLDVAH